MAEATKYSEIEHLTHIYLNRNELDNLSHFHLYNVKEVISVEIKENKIKKFELDVLQAFPALKKIDLQANQIDSIKSTNRKAGIYLTYIDDSCHYSFNKNKFILGGVRPGR